MSQADEDTGDKQISEWVEASRPELVAEGWKMPEEGDVTAADGADKKVIDVDEEDEGKQRKEIAARSNMWMHFTKIKENGVVVRGKCNYCSNKIAAHPVHNGTSAMRRHFNSCKRNPHRVSDDSKQGVLVNEGTNLGTWKFDPDLLRAAFSEMIIEDEQPFAFGEKPGFKKFMALACPRFIIPSRRTCTRDTVQLYFQQKAKLNMFFKEHCDRVCLTTDGWTSQTQDSYMTVTAHFIDNDWCLHKKIISFFKVKGKKGMILGNTCRKYYLSGVWTK